MALVAFTIQFAYSIHKNDNNNNNSNNHKIIIFK